MRLKLGEMSEATVFNDDPADQARSASRPRASSICTSSISTAPSPASPSTARAVDAILKAISIPSQLGGGIRDLGTIETWLAKGVRRVILGTIARARSGTGARKPARRSRAASLSASTPRAAKSRSKAGLKPPSFPPSISPSASRMPASAAIIYTDIDARRRAEGPQSSTPRPSLRAPSGFRSSPRAASPPSTMSSHCCEPRIRHARRRHHRPRAL